MKTCGGRLSGWPASLPLTQKSKTLKAQVIFLEYEKTTGESLAANAAQRGLKKNACGGFHFVSMGLSTPTYG